MSAETNIQDNILSVNTDFKGDSGGTGCDDESSTSSSSPNLTKNTNDNSPTSVTALGRPVKLIKWKAPTNFEPNEFFIEDCLKHMSYPNDGDMIDAEMVFTCGWCKEVMYEGVNQFYCHTCKKDACIRCSPNNNSRLCIGCSKTVCSQCDNKNHLCTRCAGYICDDKYG